MRTLNVPLRNLTAALALGALGIGFAPAAGATAAYNAFAAFDLTLVSVLDDLGQDPGGWFVDAEGFVIDISSAEIGNATSDAVADVVGSPPIEMAIGQFFFHLSAADGMAVDGESNSHALTDLGITIENDSGGNLTFNFDWTAAADAEASAMFSWEEAYASALVEVFDDNGDVDVLLGALVGPLYGPDQDLISLDDSGSFAMMLADGEFNFITAYVDTDGYATADPGAGAIPAPTSLLLLALGLIGLGVARRRQSH